MTFVEHARAVSAFKGSARGVKESSEICRSCASACAFPSSSRVRSKMSDVRLSNASPTVERVDARQPESVRSGARRSLFGRPDPEELRRFWDASQRESVRDFRERYNYDPVTGTPLPGGVYEWERDEAAPEFYRRLPHGSRPPPPRGEARDSPDRGEESRTRTESAPETNGSRKRRSGASGSCFDECPKKRSKSDRDDDDDDDDDEEDCVGGVVKTSSRSEDNQEVLVNAEH